MKTPGYWWAFTNDSRQFFNLRINADEPKDWELVDAYNKHPRRFADSESVVFFLIDNNGNRKVRSVTMAAIKEYEDLTRSFQEDLEQTQQEQRS